MLSKAIVYSNRSLSSFLVFFSEVMLDPMMMLSIVIAHSGKQRKTDDVELYSLWK